MSCEIIPFDRTRDREFTAEDQADYEEWLAEMADEPLPPLFKEVK